ncbi:MAG: error-prone DNA polymerase [Chitinophagaceae bacterium]
MRYTELQTTSNFSFLRGASHPEELVDQAAEYGYTAIAITDRNSFAGIVRAHVAAKKKGIRIIPACRLDLLDGPSLLAYPTTQYAYTQLSALLTLGNLRAEKGECHLYKADVYAYAREIKLMAIPPARLNNLFDFEPVFRNTLHEYKTAFGSNLYLAATRLYNGDDLKYLHRLNETAAAVNIPMVATNDVYYHQPARRSLQDILTCIREKCTIHNAGFRLHQNAERHLKAMDEMKRLFRGYPDAIRYTEEINEACQFSLDTLKYVYPEELTSEGRTPLQELEFLAREGARNHFGLHIPDKINTAIAHELKFIEEMNYAAYFLTVYDIVRFARGQHILCQGRGSAANSTICFCLGITSVDPTKFDLLFERFISSARNEPPDIDVDFEHERREEVIQYIYKKYGRDRAAIVATVTQERQKGAIRDVGKAMGLSVDTINRLSATEWEFTEDWFNGNLLEKQGLNPADKHVRNVLQLTAALIGFPRQLGQHTGGFVITQGKLSDLCPIMNARMEDRTCIEWNKDDIDAVGFLKIDILALGMLTCIRKAFDLCKLHYGKDLTLANIPQDDPQVYDMIGHAETIGVFQIESRAQQAMLPRLKPKCFYDLVIEVAIVRPGPIQGDMVHPYLRRRNKEEDVDYPSQELKDILHKTLGVPLFQEQAMKIAIVAAGFSPAEADELRRSMATFKAVGMVKKFEEKLVNGMVANGYTKEYALRVFKQLEGFGSYGFPESHAASFAQLVYVSSWLKCYHPDVFAAALLNSMPMGFYQPAQIIIDAAKNGVVIKPVDVNFSYWNNTLEEKDGRYCIIRLGFRQVKGLREADMQLLVQARQEAFTNIHALMDTGVSLASVEKLGDADAFISMGLDRRHALWQINALGDRPLALFAGQSAAAPEEANISLPAMSAAEEVVQDYAATSLSLKAHPVSFVREKLELLHITPTKFLATGNDGDLVKVAGLVLVRQRPGTAKGVCFITIEDETGVANLVVFQNLFNRYYKEIIQSRLLMVEGKLQREGEVIHIIAERCYNLSSFLRILTAAKNEDLPLKTLSRADETSIPAHAQVKPFSKEVFHEGRNFR